MRLVAELHFGFIDVPELSIQSGIGVEYSRLLLRTRVSDSLFASAERYVATSLRPIGGRGPWDIFIGNLSALYHF